MSLALFRRRAARLIRDGGGVLLDPDDFNLAFSEALKRYSRAKPRVWVVDLEGTGTFDLALPDSWDAEFSRLVSVEYPVGRRDPEMVDALDWTIYQAPSGPVLRLKAAIPADGEAVRISFLGLHQLEEGTTSIPAVDQDIVIHLAAAHCCEQLASHYTNTGDSTIGADVVDHRSKAGEYASRAQRFQRLADQLLPAGEQGEASAAGGETSFGDEIGMLTHPTR